MGQEQKSISLMLTEMTDSWRGVEQLITKTATIAKEFVIKQLT